METAIRVLMGLNCFVYGALFGACIFGYAPNEALVASAAFFGAMLASGHLAFDHAD